MEEGRTMLDFRSETFITVCKYMNYTKAAQVLHITQPAVSQHIRYIEQEYGIKIFHFQGKKMYLTDEGRMLLNAVTTLKHDEQALRRMFEEKRSGSRTLNFGVTMTIGEYVIGRYIAAYIERYPDTEVKMAFANTEELLEKLDEGKLDFALVEGYFEKSNYDYEVFSRERYIGILPPNHPLKDKKGLKVEELFEETLIIREKGSGTREVLERMLHAAGYGIEDFKKVVEVSNINAIKHLAANGVGLSFFYEIAVEKEIREGILVKMPLQGFPLYHDFNFIWRKNSIFGDTYKELLQSFT